MVDRDEIILFVKERLGFAPTPETKFWWETGTAGLDVVVFEEFAEKYGVDLEVSDVGYDYGDSDVSLAMPWSSFGSVLLSDE